jgi:hypothetical protein
MEVSRPNLDQLSVPELLRLSRDILRQLRTRGIIRSSNAPAGDYAELLTQRLTGGELAPNSQRSWDLRTPSQKRLQVKACVLTPENPSRQLSPIRSWDFDELVVVLFNDDFSILRAVFFSSAAAQAAAAWRKHVNGWILFARDDLSCRGSRPYRRDGWSDRLAQHCIPRRSGREAGGSSGRPMSRRFPSLRCTLRGRGTDASSVATSILSRAQVVRAEARMSRDCPPHRHDGHIACRATPQARGARAAGGRARIVAPCSRLHPRL